MRFDGISFACTLTPDSAIQQLMEGKQTFRLDFPNGDYVEFLGSLAVISIANDALVDVQDCKIIKRGNIYDPRERAE
jgi:hypothetical protein